jgi:hypothetical protein
MNPAFPTETHRVQVPAALAEHLAWLDRWAVELVTRFASAGSGLAPAAPRMRADPRRRTRSGARAAAAFAVEITNVCAPAVFDPATMAGRGRFRSEARAGRARIFRPRPLVRTVALGTACAGDQKLSGMADERGHPFRREAYVYTLTATAANGEELEHDRRISGDEPLELPSRSGTHCGHHSLRAACERREDRTGLDEGRCCAPWSIGCRDAPAPRRALGRQDESGLIDASNASLRIATQAWALPRNVIIVLPGGRGSS